MRVFGSYARGEASEDSDIDLLVDVADSVELFALGRMGSEAERIHGHLVDIVASNSLRPSIAERRLAEAEQF